MLFDGFGYCLIVRIGCSVTCSCRNCCLQSLVVVVISSRVRNFDVISRNIDNRWEITISNALMSSGGMGIVAVESLKVI